MILKKTLFIVAVTLCGTAHAQQTSNTEEILRRVADNVIRTTTFKFIDTKNRQTYESTSGLPAGSSVVAESSYNKWGYPNGVMTIGLIQLSDALNDHKYMEYSERNFSFIFDNLPYFQTLFQVVDKQTQGRPRTEFGAVFAMGSLDNTGAMSAGLTDVYHLVKRKDYMAYLEKSADYILHRQLRLKDGTLARLEPRNATIWADDMFMSIPFLARMGKLTGEKKYFEDAIKQVKQFSAYLYDPTTGLFWHNYYTDTKSNGVAHWARCNGWIAMSQVELLKNLPEGHPQKAELIAMLLKQIIGYSRYQDNSGLWHQLIDKPDSYLETSSTAMFVYAVATAVNEGWISQRYMGIARDGWKGLQSHVNADGQVLDVCVGITIRVQLRLMTPMVWGHFLWRVVKCLNMKKRISNVSHGARHAPGRIE
jgi:unsaturated rhamnogalacturonyl hydrolase